MSASASRSGSRKGKNAAGGSGSSSGSHKGKSDRPSSSNTVDSDYLETLQQQMKSETKSSGPAFLSKKKKSPRIVTEEAVDADELKAAMAAAMAEGGDSDHSDDGADASGDEDDAAGGKAQGKAVGGKAGAASASGKSRLIRRADESAEQYKARLKSEMKRRKIERKKAARSEVIKAQMARAHEEALERRAAKQLEHQQRVAKEKQAKLEKLERAKALEGLTNKEKRAQKHLWAQADAKRDADEATVAATTSAESASSSAVATPAASQKKGKAAAAAAAPAATELSATADVPLPAHSAWDPYNLHPSILRALLLDLKFTAPTPIQEAVLLPAIRDWKDVSAAATTGSGKTLAFGLPIIHRLLMLQEAPGWTDPRRMQALILTPTRELALQIVSHLEAVARYATPAIRVAAVVGGMAVDKQKRVLEKKRPAVIVATPGRLWELIHEAGLQHLSSAYYLRFLVLDEADRMVDFGHFPELEKILTFIDRNSSPESLTRTVRSAVEAFDGFEMLDDDEEEGDKDVTAEAAAAAAEETAKSGKRAAKVAALINKPGKVSLAKEADIDWDSFLTEEEVFKQQGRKMPKETSAVDDSKESDEEGEENEDADDEEMEQNEDDEDQEQDLEEEAAGSESESDDDAPAAADEPITPQSTANMRPLRRQIFLFSATLMLSSSGREDASKVKHGAKNRKREPATVLEKLADKISFQSNAAPCIVDLSSTHQVAATLEEVKAECVTEDKDYMVYYFLLLYPGKTLIFVNSISCLRRLTNLLTVLKLPALALHAEMQQKARIKALERFKERDNSILICTDVAARGLDIPQVPYIVHYQLARTPEIYIHRSGRVARAGAQGLSLALISETEQKQYRRLCLVLKKVDGIPSLNIDQGYMTQIRNRMALARQVDTVANAARKHKSARDWFIRQAEAMEMEIDEDELQIRPAGSKNDHEGDGAEARARDAAVQLGNLTRELDFLLSKPLMHGTLARKFYTLNAARGFDLARESAGIARAGASSLATNGIVQPPGAQNLALGTQARATAAMPDQLQKARDDLLVKSAAATAAKKAKGKAGKGVTPALVSVEAATAKPASAAAAAPAAAAAARPVISLSAKRKTVETPAETETEAEAAPAAAAVTAAATPKTKKQKVASYKK